jgi:PPOX class probable F420-dependent enzyme
VPDKLPEKVPTTSFDPAKATYVSLITYRKTGAEVKTPVWVAPLRGKHYVFSEAKAGKVKRLRNNSAIKIALCDARGKLLGNEWLEGNAKITDDPKLLMDVYKSFSKKYGWIMRITNVLAKLAGRYDKRAMIEIVLSN